jgi:hypothetical protein
VKSELWGFVVQEWRNARKIGSGVKAVVLGNHENRPVKIDRAQRIRTFRILLLHEQRQSNLGFAVAKSWSQLINFFKTDRNNLPAAADLLSVVCTVIAKSCCGPKQPRGRPAGLGSPGTWRGVPAVGARGGCGQEPSKSQIANLGPGGRDKHTNDLIEAPILIITLKISFSQLFRD